MYQDCVNTAVYIPRERLLLSCFGLLNFAGFYSSKTNANKRLFMSAKSMFLSGADVFTPSPLSPC